MNFIRIIIDKQMKMQIFILKNKFKNLAMQEF